MTTKLPFNIDVQDYLQLKKLYYQFVLKIKPLGKVLDGETRKIIEDFNELYTKLEDELHEKVVLPQCFVPNGCIKNSCTSDVEICKYVQVLQRNDSAIRIHADHVEEFEKLGWVLVGKDVRDDSFFGASDYVVMVPENEEEVDGMR